MRTEPRLDTAALQARLPDRVATALSRFRPSGRRVRAARRLLAVGLLVSAGVMASMAPTSVEDGTAVLAFARDLPAGAALAPGDVDAARVRSPPNGALSPRSSSDLDGVLLSGPVRRGEILTDARIVGDRGPDPGPGRAAVPVPFADPTIAALLAPGMHVVLARLPDRDAWTGAAGVPDTSPADPVGTPTQASTEPAPQGASPAVRVLAADAVVLSVAEPDGGGITGSRSKVVVVGVPGDVADAVSAAAASDAITIRFGP